MAVKNQSELTNLLRQELKPVVDKVVDKIYKENKDIVQQIVYDVYQPEIYQRTYEFRDVAWETTPAHNNGKLRIQGDMHFAPENMSYDADHWVHGSNYGGDVREALAEIIYQGKSGPMFGKGVWTRKRNAYNALIKRLGKRRFNSYLKEALDECGIKYEAHERAIDFTEIE